MTDEQRRQFKFESHTLFSRFSPYELWTLAKELDEGHLEETYKVFMVLAGHLRHKTDGTP